MWHNTIVDILGFGLFPTVLTLVIMFSLVVIKTSSVLHKKRFCRTDGFWISNISAIFVTGSMVLMINIPLFMLAPTISSILFFYALWLITGFINK